MKIFLTLILLMTWICQSVVADSNEIAVFSSFMQTQKQVMDKIIDKAMSEDEFRSDYNRDELYELLKQWNPHIKDWRDIGDGTNIILKTKSRYYLNLYLLREFFSTTQRSTSRGTVEISYWSYGVGGSFERRFKHGSLGIEASFFGYEKVTEVGGSSEQKVSIALPVGYSAFLTYNIINIKYNVVPFVFIGRDRFSEYGFNASEFNENDSTFSNLTKNKYVHHWIGGGLKMGFNPFGINGQARLEGGFSLASKKYTLSENNSEAASVKSYSAFVKISTKHFFYNNWWVRPSYEKAVYDAVSEMSWHRFGVHLGKLF